MKADLTRSTDRPDKHYRSVRMQQGRVQLDADWNEQQDILNRRIELETVDVIGHTGAPLAAPGFKLSGNGQNIDISAGHFYVEGLLCDNPAPASLIAQPSLKNTVSPILPAGFTQLPLPPANAAPLAGIILYDGSGNAVTPPDGIYLGYLEAWLRHVTALEDPLIREVALGGPDSATRDQLVWQVKLMRVADPGTDIACNSAFTAWDALAAVPDGKMGARAEPSKQPKDPCLLAPEAGFRRLENLLYRVEIHEDGSAGGKLRYKWSRDNGSIVSRVVRWLNDPAADEFEVASIGRDAYLSITAGCWLEFFDDTHELLGRAGTLVKVLKTEGNVVTLDLSSTTGTLDKALFGDNPRVRRWDGWDDMAPLAANSPYDTGWVELEDGVEIKFLTGHYRVGDYWTMPARTATADLEWPQASGKAQFRAPEGTLRAFARLALLSCQGGNWTTLSDCRPLFPALTELTNLYYVGGDGQEAKPNPIAPQNVKLDHPLEVAVFNGEFPVAGVPVRFTAGSGSLNGAGLSVTVNTQSNGVAAVEWSLAPTGVSQSCKAELLEAGQPAVGKYNQIDFGARLSLASQVAYDPSQCPDLQAQGISDVQGAIDALCHKSHGGGCCIGVGKGGEFATLDEALKKLIGSDQKDICLCLLPGEHQLESDIELGGKGVNLFIHGAGPASRLILRDQALQLFDFASLTLQDFDLVALTANPSLSFAGCEELRIQRMHLSGLTEPGNSLVRVEGAQRIDLGACVINAYQPASVQRARALVDHLAALGPMAAALETGKGELFASVPLTLAEAFANWSGAEREAFGQQVDMLLRSAALPLANGESEALLALRADIVAGADARRLVSGLNRLRGEWLLNPSGCALTLADAEADTLLADSHINGRVTLYGDATKEERLNQDIMEKLGQGFSQGKIRWLRGRGELRLRNNRLRELRLGDAMLQRLQELALDGGTLADVYRSLIADANVLAGLESELLGFDLALSQNVLDPSGSDVGIAIASQGKYLGNFAHNDFRLFTLGHVPEKFGNGGLNIVQI